MKKVLLILAICFSFAGLFAQSKPDALVLYRQGNYAEAIKICEQEITTNPRNIDSYCVLCWSLVRNRQYAEGELRANEARKLAPADVRLMEILAEAKYYQGKNNEALEMFRTYIASAPSNAARIGNAYYYMGEIYIRQGKYQHADISMTTAVYTEPLVDIWWTRCGYAREMAGSYATALEAYSKALELKASNADAARGKERVAARLR
ncbi:tetratricopeptide repeat protein [Treponema sp.]|uniref:tetratricopeptide repeat protein n=1 Tax=Treponema sp. TaxID=166 RepID=UPI0025FF155F|nr:tetratricopeptide repeat protein [Treponema sp.]MBR4322288.1 tetratricopeptide repeat protein [Treponema sp.]